MAAKELRYYGRDPRARAGTLIVVIFALALPIVVAISGWGRQPESVLAVGVLAAWVGLGAINQYGIEAGAYWMNVVSGVDVEDHLVGKNLGFAVWTLAVVTPLVLTPTPATPGPGRRGWPPWRRVPLGRSRPASPGRGSRPRRRRLPGPGQP
ncbi:hypothetical protein BH20ACT1_BH20ACT1_08080 [soil metagenome]